MMRLSRVFLLLLAPAAVAAQTTRTARVTVRVADTAAAALAGVEVSIVRDVSTVLAHATTEAAGRVSLTVPATSASLQVVARRIGYLPAYQFFALSETTDSLTLALTLTRSPQELTAVKVTAEQDLKRKSYHLDADDIATTTRTMLDGTDILKLRPDMLESRAGHYACGWVQNVWVNGRRITLPDIDSQYLAGHRGAVGVPMALPPRPNPRITPLPQTPSAGALPWGQFTSVDTVLSILRMIKPEHIAEVNFQDCFGGPVEKNHSEMAIFVVLKPGIGYRDDIGSYVLPADTKHAAGAAPAPVRASAPALAVDSLARYRFRLLGAFDATTGDPIAGLAVTDSASGVSARTTSTGTVSLFFLPEGTSTLRLQHARYGDTTFAVTISPRDTLPLTLLLSPRR